MSRTPSIPGWIRDYRYEGWTNVFDLVPGNDHLYATETLFGDWNSRVLLLAKDACPTDDLRAAISKGESRPWRHSQRELGDSVGVRTNERLSRFVQVIPEENLLYGSATANMMCDKPGASRTLPGFYRGKLYEYLKEVLCWVLKAMPRVERIACLGVDAWYLACTTLGDPVAARSFREYRDGFRSITGVIGEKAIAAFPLHHPSRVSNQVAEEEWRAFLPSLEVDSGHCVETRAGLATATSSY